MDILQPNIIDPEQQTNHWPAMDITNFTASWPSRQQLEMHDNGNGMAANRQAFSLMGTHYPVICKIPSRKVHSASNQMMQM
jgi:hypothetical protein